MTDYSTSWKKSTQVRKKRKYAYNAPLHIKQKQLSANLSVELRKKHNQRSIQVRKEDKVKIVRGQYKGTIGKIRNVNITRTKVQIEGLERIKKDGSKIPVNIEPSNLMVIELELSDKKRIKSKKTEEKKNG